jgi:phage gp29-like protein
MLADTLNRYAIPRLMRINAEAFSGTTGYPKIALSLSSGADVTSVMNALKVAVDASVLHPDIEVEKHARELLGLPELTEEQIVEIEADEKRKKEMAVQLQQQLAGGGDDKEGKPPFGKPKPDMGEDDEKGALKAATRTLRSVVDRFRRAPRDS